MAAAHVFRFREKASNGGGELAAAVFGPEGARTPARARERLLGLFRSPRNLAYLWGLFARTVPPGPLRHFALETLEDSLYSFEQSEDLAYSDPAARGAARPAADLWGELRRLNRAFYGYRARFLRDKAALITGRSRDGQQDDDEPYHYRMFVADSLRPPGLERLNEPGPLYEIRENQTAPAGDSRAAGPVPAPGVDPDDWGWDGGDPYRTPEQALAEYWGDERVESSALGATETGGEAYIDRYGQGARWQENGGTRFMRYPAIPIWQNLSRGRNYDRGVEETLGTGDRELDNHVRRWGTGMLPSAVRR